MYSMGIRRSEHEAQPVVAHIHMDAVARLYAIIIFELKYLFERLRRSANCSVPAMDGLWRCVCVCASFVFCCGTFGMGS